MVLKRLNPENIDVKYSSDSIIAQQVITFFLQNLDSNPNIHNIAETLQISESHLRNIFQNIFKKSPKQILNKLKADRAQYLLRTTNLTLDEIAVKLGFSETSPFVRMFKKHCGINPGEYRKNTKSF